MKFIFAAMCLYPLEWVGVLFSDFKWDFLLCFQLVSVALLVSGVVALCEHKSLLLRSALLIWVLMAWGDVLKFVLWAVSERSLDVSTPVAFIFSIWLLFILRRRYDKKSGPISSRNVILLIKKPKGVWEVFKSLFGAPTPSICIGIENTVWAFRKRTGIFESFSIPDTFTETHTAIDTGIASSDNIINELNAIVGTPRGIPCKCVWSIRHPLNMLGGKFNIKTWFDYIPGLYVLRIL